VHSERIISIVKEFLTLGDSLQLAGGSFNSDLYIMTRQNEKVAGLILAAGASSRMGKSKQLLKVSGKTLVERILDEALRSNLDRVILVLGHEAGKIRELLATYSRDARLEVIENIHYREGISSSIITGLGAVEKEFGHIMILLADMPHINSEIINHLLNRYLASGKTLGAISLSGRRSHPVILGRVWYRALHDLKGDVGARGLFDASKEEVCLVDALPSYNDMDLDTTEDYEAALLLKPL